ncbi:hypothetical protein CVIRNUC_005751 [Coccomyxa viridis]|uniref:F-box domain-containing protein n=1 Tax=Coccomyxa viridis TaxID=1274662 RepID=A0AAV1I6Z9_9CHLO|nr:hypothetical protein CVIRNUC_005751 [Coccomyxa viridis]
MQLLQRRRKKGRNELVEEVPSASASINECLDIDLLQSVFACLDQEHRIKTVPLVCRTWRDAAAAPSIMWERLRLAFTLLKPAQICSSEVMGEVQRPSRLAPWLAARSRSIHALSICILDDAAARHMTDGLLLATLPLLPALQELHIFSTGTISSSNIALIASLSRAHCKLQELSLSFSPLKDFVPAHLNVLERMDALTSLSISLHAAARHMRESMGGHPRWHGDLPSGLCNLPKLTELDLSFRAFGQAELCLPQAFTRLTSLKKLRLDSCGRVRCHPDLASGMLRQLDDVSLRQCRLGNMGCLDVLLGLPKLRELRIEDCTSDAGAEPAPWGDTMRVMPPLLELADMFNLILRRCRSSRADSDLVRAGSRLQRMLHARCNQLSALPAALTSAWRCFPTRLTLRYCGLRELPRGRYLSTLTVLDLEGNSFLAIPEVLRHARQLTHLDLSCNHGLQVGLPDVHTLLQLHTLRILDLSKVSERPPHEAPPLPNEVLPYWTKGSLLNLAAVVCWRHAASMKPAAIQVTSTPGDGPEPCTDLDVADTLSCLRMPVNAMPLEVSVMLLGAPWLSAACIKFASWREPGKVTFDMEATCEAYVKSVVDVMSPTARLAMARKARRNPNWRRLTWHLRWAEFKDGLSNVFAQLIHRLRLQQR